MFAKNVLGIFTQLPIILYAKGPSYNINYDAHTWLFINGDSLVTNSPNNSAILDSSANNFTITNAGSVLQGSISPFDPFEKSAYFNGSSYINIPSTATLNLSNVDYTVECWLNHNAQSVTNASFYCGNSNNGAVFSINTNSKIQINPYGIGTFISFSYTPKYNTWYHLAITRQSGSTRCFINGLQVDITKTDTTTYAQTDVNIGGITAGGQYYTGYISDLRITKGQALYISNFIPPTLALSLTGNGGAINASSEPLSSNVSLLTLQTPNLFKDNSANNFTLTNTNVVSYPLYPNASSNITYSSSANGGSLYYTGTNYLSVASNTQTALSSFDFTIECWLYFTNALDTAGSPSYTGLQAIYTNYTSWGANSIFFGKHWNNSGKVSVYINNNNPNNAFISEPTLPPNNQWVHYALVRSGSSFAIYRNGTQTISAGYTGVVTGSANPNLIGTLLDAGSLYPFKGYISDFRITKGQALYTTNFTPPSAPLSLTDNGGATPSVAPLSSNVGLHLKGTNAEILDAVSKNNILVTGSVRLNNGLTDQIIADQSTNNFSLTTYNNLDVSTNSVYAVSGFSGYFSGTGYLTVPASNIFSLSADFTVECWINTTVTTNDFYTRHICSLGTGADASNLLKVNLAPNTITVYNTAAIITGTKKVNDGAWHHIAVTRSGTNLKLFIDGVQDGSTATNSTNFNAAATTNLRIGVINVNTGTNANQGRYIGYMSDVRITNTQALYTSNFTPPTLSLSLTSNGGSTPSVTPLSSNVGLLTLQTQDKTFKDNSVNNFTLSNINVKPISINPFYFNENVLTYGGSLYYTGTNYLSIASNTQTALSSFDFTIEFWIYLTNANANAQQIFYTNYTAWGANAIYFGKNTGTPAGKVCVAINNFNPNANFLIEPTFPPNNEWTHYALVRSGSTFSIYRNGVQTVSAGNTGTVTGATNPNFIGTSGDNTNIGIQGYLSDFRITKGQALYTSNFTPPSASFLSLTSNGGATPSIDPLSSNVGLLLNNFVPSLTTNNKAINFPQNGFLRIPNVNDILTLGSGDFTIEFKLYNSTANAVLQTVIDQRIDATTQARLLVTINTSNKLVVEVNGLVTTSTNTVPFKKWTKYSIFKTNGALGIAVNDIVDADSVIAESNTHLAPTNGTLIGTNVSPSSASPLLAYVDDFKVIKGVSKFTGYVGRAGGFDYLVVAGGGGGAKYPSDIYYTSGAGAGGLLQGNISTTANYVYNIAVGAGGAGGLTTGFVGSYGNNGGDSTLSTPAGNITSIGGGGASSVQGSGLSTNGANGGCGSGSSSQGGGSQYAKTGGAGTAGQGLSGASSGGGFNEGVGGGGAGAAGGNPNRSSAANKNGGVGIQWLNGNFYAGGGGGAGGLNVGTAAGTGGAGGGGDGILSGTANQNPGQINTGGGAGGACGNQSLSVNKTRIVASGGSGVIILRTLLAARLATVTGSPTITTSGIYRYYTFTGSGTIKF